MLKNPRISHRAGALLTVVLSSLLIFLLFSRHILEANTTSFAGGGDGLKSTFGSIYHIKYDTSYWRFEGMNYPFGESVLFTGNQTTTVNLLKLLKNAGIDLSDYTLGILNLLMLFSYVLCALFLFLIIREFGTPPWYALTAALVMTFLSPQWARMSGHYNLAYAWVIPAALYMLIRFYRKPSYLVSVLFGLYVLVISGKHLYFVLLVGVPWAVFWLVLLIRSGKLYGKTGFLLPHLIIQMILPFLLYSLLSFGLDNATDRTAYPWGFFSVNTRWVSVFLPLMKPYAKWIVVGPVKTLGYVGMVSTLVFALTILLLVLRRIRRDRTPAFDPFDRPVLNIFLAAGILCLFLALGYPFQFHPPLLNYTGPFRQFRAMGRFVIPFYYILNIWTFYFLWKWFRSSAWKGRSLFLGMALLIAGTEAWFHVRAMPDWLYNKYETLNDRENRLPDNAWVGNHDWSEYQAIMPMPYYHIGSEAYWYGDGSPVTGESYIASLKTGLPLNSVMLSRTSISQTLASLDLVWEPNGNYPVLSEYDPLKPVLVMKHRTGVLNENEKRILEKCEAVDSNAFAVFYALYTDSLQRIQDEYGAAMAEKASMLEGRPRGWFCFESYDSLENGHFNMPVRPYRDFFACPLPDSGDYTVSFWYQGAGKDLWPRTFFFVSLFDTAMNSYYYRQSDYFRETVMREGEWGLVEFRATARAAGDYLKLDYFNRYLTGGDMILDRVLVRPDTVQVVLREAEEVMLNNRPVPETQSSR